MPDPAEYSDLVYPAEARGIGEIEATPCVFRLETCIRYALNGLNEQLVSCMVPSSESFILWKYCERIDHIMTNSVMCVVFILYVR